jgi:4-amino-4-deoxy-L-arabinose transferase-like glycosyltransferase
MRKVLPALLLIVLVTILFLRFWAPSGLHTKDQPKTCSYTVDMIENGRWFWARDQLGRAATKPPLYNWLSAPAILLTGRYDEWLLQLPSLLAGFAVVAIAMLMARRLPAPPTPRPGDPRPESDKARRLANARMWMAGMAALGNYATYRLIYTARPDMLFTFLLVAGWACATVLITEKPEGRKRVLLAAGLWLAFAGAVLTKGPPAVLLLLYQPLLVWWTRRPWRTLLRTGFRWGLPLALAVIGGWLLAAALSIPEGQAESLFGHEVHRVVGGGVLKWITSSYLNLQFFFQRYMPWSFLFVATLVRLRPARWRTTSLAPAILWTFLVFAFFYIPANRRDDYLMPIYPVAAVPVAWLLVDGLPRFRRGAVYATLIALLVIWVGGMEEWYVKKSRLWRWDEHCKEFVHRVRRVADPREIVFYRTGYNTLQAWLGRNQWPPVPTPEMCARARWIVCFVANGIPEVPLQRGEVRGHPNGLPFRWPPELPEGCEIEPIPVLVSGPLPMADDGKYPGYVAMFRIRRGPDDPPQ